MRKPNTIGLGEYTDEDLLAELKERQLFSRVTRLETITPKYGRTTIFWDDNLEINLSLQDDGKTLKVFVDERTLPLSS